MTDFLLNLGIRIGQLIFYTAMVSAFLGVICAEYGLHKPSLIACAALVLLFETLGYAFRGKLENLDRKPHE